MYTEVALYSTQISNLLVARRTANDQFIELMQAVVRIQAWNFC
jgi:hypothetical protein